MDFSDQLIEEKTAYDTENSEGANLLKDAQSEQQLEEDTAQEAKFKTAFDGTSLSLSGPSNDDYDYPSEFKQKGSFSEDDNKGITLQNKNFLPSTQEIAGFDAVTGTRFNNNYSDRDGVIKDGVLSLQKSHVNTATGSPPEDMHSLSKVAQGMNDDEATYEDFVANTQSGSWSDQQRTTAWDGMKQATQTASDVEDMGARHVEETKDMPKYVRHDGVQEDIDEEELVSSPLWLDSGKTVAEFFNPGSSEGMTEEEIHENNLEMMSRFNYDIPYLMYYANGIIGSEDPELAKSFLYLMDQADATNMSWSAAGRATYQMATDVTTYMTLGGGILASRAAGNVMKYGIKQAVTKIAAMTAAESVIGAATGAGVSVAKQGVEVAAGDKPEIDVGEVAKEAALTAAVTAVTGLVGGAADPVLRKFGVDSVKGAAHKMKPFRKKGANTYVPSLKRTIRNSFSDQSYGQDGYKELTIEVGGSVIGHLRMEISRNGSQKGTMFLGGAARTAKAGSISTEGMSTALLFRSAITEAMAGGSKFMAWPKDQPFMGKYAKQLAKQYGFEIESFSPKDVKGKFSRIVFNRQNKDKWVEEGQYR